MIIIGADVCGIVYRPYGKKKKDYDMPSGPAFEDEAEFEKDLLKSDLMKKPTTSTEQNDEDDEFDFDISTTKTFSLPPSAAPLAPRLDNLKLTTLGGKDESENRQFNSEDGDDYTDSNASGDEDGGDKNNNTSNQSEENNEKQNTDVINENSNTTESVNILEVIMK